MTNTPTEAMAAARQQSLHGPQFGEGECLWRVHDCYGVGNKYPDAATAFSHTKFRHSTPAPEGVPVWWTGGSHGFGHVAISVGGGICWTTDFKRPGYFDLAPISEITRAWGLTYQGWTEDINDVRVIVIPLNTRWYRVRKALLATLNSPDALNIEPNRRLVRAFLATTRAALLKLKVD